MNQSPPRATRRIVFVAAPGTEILDLVGPLQVFARAAEMFGKQNPGSPPIYSVEVITTSAHRSFVANCGLRITAHKTFREVRGKIDTLLIAGGNAPGLGAGGRRLWLGSGVAGRAQSRPLSAAARWPIAIQRRAVAATDRPQTVARARIVGVRQLEQTAHRASAGAPGRDESSQFRPCLYQRVEDDSGEVC